MSASPSPTSFESTSQLHRLFYRCPPSQSVTCDAAKHLLLRSVSVSPECITAFNDLKLGKSTKWIIYKISDDWKEIVVEATSTTADYSAFREKLLSAKSKDRKGKEGMGGRYAVYDMEYDTDGEGKRYVLPAGLCTWSCPFEQPMLLGATR